MDHMALSDTWEAQFANAPVPILLHRQGVILYGMQALPAEMDGYALRREIRGVEGGGRQSVTPEL